MRAHAPKRIAGFNSVRVESLRLNGQNARTSVYRFCFSLGPNYPLAMPRPLPSITKVKATSASTQATTWESIGESNIAGGKICPSSR